MLIQQICSLFASALATAPANEGVYRDFRGRELRSLCIPCGTPSLLRPPRRAARSTAAMGIVGSKDESGKVGGRALIPSGRRTAAARRRSAPLWSVPPNPACPAGPREQVVLGSLPPGFLDYRGRELRDKLDACLEQNMWFFSLGEARGGGKWAPPLGRPRRHGSQPAPSLPGATRPRRPPGLRP